MKSKSETKRIAVLKGKGVDYKPTVKCYECPDGNEVYEDGLCVRCYKAEKLVFARIEKDKHCLELSLENILDYLEANEDVPIVGKSLRMKRKKPR